MADVPNVEDRARAVYELHVIHPTTAERHTQQLKNLFLDLLLPEPFMGARLWGDGNTYVKVTMEIVERSSRRTVLCMDQKVEVAPGVADLIEADLDRLDAATFADEWGITPHA